MIKAKLENAKIHLPIGQQLLIRQLSIRSFGLLNCVQKFAVVNLSIALIISSMLMSGCLSMGWSVTSAEWEQPEVWEEFPEEGEELNGFRIDIHDELKTATKDKWSSDIYITVRDEGDVRFRISSRSELSQNETWERLEQSFQDLSLPEPTLDRSYEFDWGRSS